MWCQKVNKKKKLLFFLLNYNFLVEKKRRKTSVFFSIYQKGHKLKKIKLQIFFKEWKIDENRYILEAIVIIWKVYAEWQLIQYAL